MSCLNLTTAKQRITRLLNDLSHIISECSQYSEGWEFPKNPKELYIFIRTQRNIVNSTVEKLEMKLEKVTAIYGETMTRISEVTTDSDELAKNLQAYWEERNGESILEEARAMIQDLEMRVTELATQDMHIAYADEFDAHLRQRDMPQSDSGVDFTPLVNFPTSSQPITGAHSYHGIPAHWYRRELRIPDFDGTPTEFEAFWEIFTELVDKQPYSNIEKLTILLDKCKGEAARALKYFPRKASGYADAVKQLKEQFHNKELNVKFLLEQLEQIPQSSENASHLRRTVNDLMAIITPLSRAECHIDAIEYKTKVLHKFPPSIQRKLLSKEYDDATTWTMEKLMSEIRVIVKKLEITQVHTSGTQFLDKSTVLYARTKSPLQYRCAACEGSHKIRFCNRYRTAKERKERIRNLRKCFKCFSTKHSYQDCIKPPCRNCNGPHNTALCRPSRSPSRSSSRDRTRETTKESHGSAYSLRERGRSSYKLSKNRTKSKDCSSSSESRSRSHRYSSGTSPSPDARLRKSSTAKRSPTPMARSSMCKSTNMVVNSISATEISDSTSDSEEVIHLNNISIRGDNPSRLMIAEILLRNPLSNEAQHVYALFDTGATRSFISTNLVKRLKLSPLGNTAYLVSTFGGRLERKRSQKVVAEAIGIDGQALTMNFLTSATITEPVMIPRLSAKDIDYALTNIPEPHLLNRTDVQVLPDVLIGIDYYNNIINTDEPSVRLPSSLLAVPTFFGHVIAGSGSVKVTANKALASKVFITLTQPENENPDLSAMWALENFGITDSLSEPDENTKIWQQFSNTIEVRGKQIFVKFPWKMNRMDLSDNYKVALSRLHQLYNSLHKNEVIWAAYCKIISEQLERNIIEDVPQFESSENCPIYYIPHQAVIKPSSSTTKVRIVLDASSKMVGQLSLNDVLYKGPTILPTLLGILLRIRKGTHLVIGDVEKAFHMIRLQESERNATRFLWLKDTSRPPTHENIRELRFTRVPFGTKTSPSLLAMSIKFMLERNSNQTLCKEIARNLYVDNMILNADTAEEAVSKYQSSKRIFESMSMNIREFATNSVRLRSIISENDKSKSTTVKLLGIPWNTETDSLVIHASLQFHDNPTKRSVLRAIHANFDPLGFLIPLLIPARIFLQNLWAKGYEWDDQLSEEDVMRWKSLCEDTRAFTKDLRRNICASNPKQKLGICTFVDASNNAYAACSYLRKIESDTIESYLICAKYRLAPIAYLTAQKTVTIPKLELLALLIGSQITDFIWKELDLPIETIRIFSDSTIALSQLHSGRNAGAFVNNRVRKMRSLYESWVRKNVDCAYYYVNSCDNIADCATRGLNNDSFQNHEWWTGPAFLRTPLEDWTSVDKFDMKWSQSEVLLQLHCKEISERSEIFRYGLSNWNKMKRATAIVLKFIKRISKSRYKHHERQNNNNAFPCSELLHISDTSEIDAQDMQLAENVLIRDHYRTMTERQMRTFRHLNLTMSNCIYRCKGRLENSHLDYDTANPILLLPHHILTRLIVQHTHVKVGHQGVSATLSEVQRKYWIPQGRQIVKKILRKCMICKKTQGLPYKYPDSPPLPEQRVRISRPFEHIGIDYAGPFTVKCSGSIHEKRWISLITCMSTRAIHLEIVQGLSAIEFIRAFRRFISRRGTPRSITSDNASTFEAGRKIIDEFFESSVPMEDVNKFLANEGIQWNFITPLSPWKGGFYERLIGSVKSCLRKTLRRKFVTDDEFSTVVTECEAIVNSRPLTYVSSEHNDIRPVRPIDFIHPLANVTPWKFEPDYDPNYKLIATNKEANELLKETKDTLAKFWNVWTDIYLRSLQFLRTDSFHSRSCRNQPHIGAIVLIEDESTPRSQWNLGLITALHPGADQLLRTVSIRKANGKIMKRSIISTN